MSFFNRLKNGLSKTRSGLVTRLNELLVGNREITEELYDELEEILIQADVGVQTTLKLVQNLRQLTKENKLKKAAEVRQSLMAEIEKTLTLEENSLNVNKSGLTVIMVVGVNGAGKTTTIGKLAANFKKENQRVLLAAGDTFRAAAIEQLEVWSDRSGAELIKHQEGSDPAAVAYDALQAALSRQVDVLIIDTAGRLQNKKNLMDELNKIFRVLQRELPAAPHEVLLVLDATTGQNALSQAQIFKEVTNVTGIVLTKLDGTAKGGVIIALADLLKIPVKFIGVGEGIEDLRPFEEKEFVLALFGEEEQGGAVNGKTIN